MSGMNSPPIELSSESIERIATRVTAMLAAKSGNKFVLNRCDAKTYVGKASDDAFDAWRKRWKVAACSHGRYARRVLDRALEKEARS